MDHRPDVLVLGAGVIGASAAYYLARAGLRSLVLDAGTPGAGTTANSFAWVNAVHKEPEAYHRLNADGIAAYAALVAEVGTDVGYRGGGSLEWAEDDEAGSELRARVVRLRGRGYPVEWLDPEAARRIEPGLAIGHAADGIAFFASDGWVDGPRLVEVLLDRAKAMGAAVRSGTRVSALRRRGERMGALVGDAVIGAEHVLVCVGPATATLLATAGVTLPVGRVPGLLALTSPPAEPLGHVVHAPGVHLRPDPSGGLVLGAPDVDRLITDATPAGAPLEFCRPLLERAQRVFPPARAARLLSARVGVRPMPADRQTIAGRIPGFVNAWVIATHSGITLGPLLGRLVAGEIVAGRPSPRLEPFRPDRFAPRTGDIIPRGSSSETRRG